MNKYFMRFLDSSEIKRDFVPVYSYRELSQDHVDSTKDSSGQGGSAFLMFVAIVVGVSGIFLYCSFYLLKYWLCGRSRRDVSGVSDNFSFSLSTRQRRVILETIFSDASKASTKMKPWNLFDINPGFDESRKQGEMRELFIVF
jgi:hypothetical protein